MKKTWIILILFIFVLTILILTYKHTKNNSSFAIEEATIESVQTAIKNHQLTCEQLVTAYIDRIKKYNLSIDQHPPINAIARINGNVFDQARILDKKFRNSKKMGRLFCIPVLLKDNIDSYDSSSSSGSLSLLGNQPVQDAFLTQKLRDADAVILGKGAMDEFASGISGISGGNGRTGNAYDTMKNSGGSSSGPAVAVSANFVAIGIGTDNSGSVRIPAAFNSIVGLRPSTGLISQQGIFPRGNLDGIAGPLTRNVKDLAIVLDVIAQPDPRDKKTLNIVRPKTYLDFLNRNAFKDKRIGVVHHLGKINLFKEMPNEAMIIFQESLERMQGMGATIINGVDLPKFNLDRHYNQAGEKEDINTYLAAYPAVREDYYDICESERTRVFGTSTECLQFARSSPKKFGSKYYKALAVFRENKKYIENLMTNYHLDALLIPVSSTGSATYINKAMIGEVIASNAGLPAITINIGYIPIEKMPMGIELIGKQFSEGSLLGMAYSYEQNASARVSPTMSEINKTLENIDIEEYNNLLTNIGYVAYNKVLIACSPDKFYRCLSPEVFQNIVKKQIEKIKNKEVEKLK